MDPFVTGGLEHVRIARRQGLSSESIYREHLSGEGVPVILTEAIDEWPALSSWNLDFFKRRYGSDTVIPGIGGYGKSMRVMKLSDFIDYVELPSRNPPGFWIDPNTRLPREEEPEDRTAPLYLADWKAFSRHSELWNDVQPDPDCLDDWLGLLPGSLRRLLQETPNYYPKGLLIGPAGSLFHLHYDVLNSHGYLAQIVGRKLCILYPPSDSGLLYHGQVNPEDPDLEKFPLFSTAKAFVCILEPGEMLLIPSRWWHQIRNLEPSITMNYNFFNRTNFGAYCVSLLKALPEFLDAFERIPGWQQELDVSWKSKGFERLPD
jgi:hypothetical protein